MTPLRTHHTRSDELRHNPLRSSGGNAIHQTRTSRLTLYFYYCRNIVMKVTDANVTRYADMFAALGAEPRLKILRLLLSAHPDGMVVGEIQAETGIANSTLSHHLEKLKIDELVTVDAREGVHALPRQRGGARGAARLSLRRVLHAEQSGRAQEDRGPLQIKDTP